MAQPRSPQLTPPVAVHLYRGMMDQACAGRARIDGTTNWAVLSAGSIASFALSERDHPHLIVLLGLGLTFGFLWIEARCFRFFDLWAGWVRIFETEYMAPVLRDNSVPVTAPWHALLMHDLDTPHFKLSHLQALGIRLRQHYWAIFGFLLVTWLLKLTLSARAPRSPCVTVLDCAAIGPLSGGVVVCLIALFYGMLLSLVCFTVTVGGGATDLLNRQQCLRRVIAPAGVPVGYKRYAPRTDQDTSVLGPPEED